MSLRGNKYGSSIPVASEDGGFNTRRTNFSASSDGENPFLERFQKTTEQLDNILGVIAQPVKPYLPGVGRFLIVATFLEDAFRIITQWRSQVSYIWNVRNFPYIIAVSYLVLNVLCMFAGSFSVIFKKRLELGVAALLFVVISQALVYGLVTNFSFFFRNLSLCGGLLMVVSDAFMQDRRSLSLPGLPVIEDKDRSKYFQLTGRILLIFLFLAYMISKKWTIIGGIFNIVGLAACILVVIGYKARLSASFLVVVLSIQNLIANPYWQYHSRNPTRDFLRYEFFQTLSIVGGLILLVTTGAGRISVDEKRKVY